MAIRASLWSRTRVVMDLNAGYCGDDFDVHRIHYTKSAVTLNLRLFRLGG